MMMIWKLEMMAMERDFLDGYYTLCVCTKNREGKGDIILAEKHRHLCPEYALMVI